MLFQIYLPCYLIVVLAWVSFWVDREQTAARIAMGITTVLTMATLIGSARTSLPKVSYIKSLELFLIMCFLFVFSAILEYAFVSYLVFKNREEEREKETMRKKHDDVSGRKKQKARKLRYTRRRSDPLLTAINNVLTNGIINQKASEFEKFKFSCSAFWNS